MRDFDFGEWGVIALWIVLLVLLSVIVFWIFQI
jgi:hypothetical protein